MSEKFIHVLLADDHTLVRAGFRVLLQSLPDIQVVAEASDGQEALQLIAIHRPNIVLMDIGMPRLNGLEATGQIAQKFPTIKVIILSMHATEEYVLRALQNGAAGYLLKDAGTSELELAIRAVMRGETYLSPAVSKHVIAEYTRRLNNQPTSLELLTLRQRSILQLIAKGYTTKEIAKMLHLSAKTVETHRMQLMTRLDIHDIAGLVRYAIRMGLITPDE